MLYAIDFDDTLNYTKKTDQVYNPNHGLISFLQDKDFVILTARRGSDSNLAFIKNFTKEFAINPVGILFSNDGPKGPILKDIGASILIDDNEEQRISSSDYGIKAIHPDDLRKKIASKRLAEGLSAEPVDAEHLSDKSWYQTEDGDDTWYYWDDKKTKQSDMPLSVDPALKDLVKFLFENDIETMPSCEGHATSRKDALKIFKKLTDEEREINEEGLPLVNTEDHSDKIIFKDKDYKLEINDPEELIQEDYSGYIGIKLKNKSLLNYIYEQISDIDDDVRVSINKSILNISVNTDDEKKKESLWKELSEIIISELDVAKKKARFNRIFSLNKIAKNKAY